MITVVYAHPYPSRSRACAALLSGVADVDGLEVRSLYELYPDFDIAPLAERAALERARLVVWLHPLYWYTAPALLKHWFDQVLVRGWAYGQGGTALHGKDCLWVTTTGAGGWSSRCSISSKRRIRLTAETYKAPLWNATPTGWLRPVATVLTVAVLPGRELTA